MLPLLSFPFFFFFFCVCGRSGMDVRGYFCEILCVLVLICHASRKTICSFLLFSFFSYYFSLIIFLLLLIHSLHNLLKISVLKNSLHIFLPFFFFLNSYRACLRFLHFLFQHFLRFCKNLHQFGCEAEDSEPQEKRKTQDREQR